MQVGKYTFFENVYAVVKLVPAGRVTSYGAIASYLGTKGSARMVGWAMNAAVNNDRIPAHRVVNRVGMLTGRLYFAYPERMQELLEAEGVKVRQHQVVDFNRIFWDPAAELI